MVAEKLRKGDEIRVLAPSKSLSVVNESVITDALEYLRDRGYRITFSKHCREAAYDGSAGIREKVEDLHDAFMDQNVKAIITALGGFNVNQLLEYIDYSIIREHPKMISGYSDTTALLNAIYAKTGVVTYHGPHFCTFGKEQGREYTMEYFEKCVAAGSGYKLVPSAEAGDYQVLQEGVCEGTILGGNLCTLNLLQGTEFMPELQDVILFLEDDNIMGEYFVPEFERNLHSLLQVRPGGIKGLVFGRFTEDCRMTAETAARIVKNIRWLKDVPVIFNADFGHVSPLITFPIGGTAAIAAEGKRVEITVKNE